MATDSFTVAKDDRVVCNYFFTLLCVNNDGTVACCCVDYSWNLIIGDIQKQHLSDIWESQKPKTFFGNMQERKTMKRFRMYVQNGVQCRKKQ